MQQPKISDKAKALAKQIPDEAGDYALALKEDIAEERFDEAMQLLVKHRQRKKQLADIYTAKRDTQYYQGLYAKAAEWYQKSFSV